jgi:hypothetical protein
VGVELAERALGWARQTDHSRPDGSRFRFVSGSIFDLPLLDLGRFDLIVITGVLYPQYIGDAFSVIDATVQDSLAENGPKALGIMIISSKRSKPLSVTTLPFSAPTT